MPSVLKQSRNRPFRYYIYISQTKLEILLPQVPERLLRSLEADIKINVVAFAANVKKSTSAPSPALAAKAGVLSEYLEKQRGWVGTLANPGRYVKGVATLQYGVMQDYAAELAFFGGEVDGMKLALIGSPASLIGAAADTAANHSLDYYVLRFLRQQAEDAQESESGASYEAAVEAALTDGVLPPTRLQLEFLAKPLFHNDRVFIATPIYVALAD